MDVIKEIENGINNCNWLLNNDIANAKEHKMYYSDEVDVLIKANEKFLNAKTKELEAWCEASAAAWEIPQKGVFRILKRKILMSIANNHIDKISRDMFRSGRAREELEKIKSRFDGFIYLTS